MADETNRFDKLKRTRSVLNLMTPTPTGGLINMLGGGMLGASIIATFVAVILGTFLLLFLNPGVVKGGSIKPSPGSPPPPSSTSSYPTPDCLTVDQRLKNDFGVLIKESGETVSCVKRQEIYRIYSIPFQSQVYRKFLDPTRPFTLEFFSRSDSLCKSEAETSSAYLVKFYGLSRYLGCGAEALAGFHILHETGHIISLRNYTFSKQQFPYNTLLGADRSCFDNCSYGPIIKTYGFCWNNFINETFAESSSLYIYNSKVGSSGTIRDFKNQCATSWKYQNTNLFGGTIIRP